MNRMDILVLLFLVGASCVVATAYTLSHKPDHYFLLTNANDTHFEISEYVSSGWSSMLIHVYAFQRPESQSPPIWEAVR